MSHGESGGYGKGKKTENLEKCEQNEDRIMVK
jgi:hypothetical protein